MKDIYMYLEKKLFVSCIWNQTIISKGYMILCKTFLFKKVLVLLRYYEKYNSWIKKWFDYKISLIVSEVHFRIATGQTEKFFLTFYSSYPDFFFNFPDFLLKFY